jgi:hypothetical protein
MFAPIYMPLQKIKPATAQAITGYASPSLPCFFPFYYIGNLPIIYYTSG